MGVNSCGKAESTQSGRILRPIAGLRYHVTGRFQSLRFPVSVSNLTCLHRSKDPDPLSCGGCLVRVLRGSRFRLRDILQAQKSKMVLKIAALGWMAVFLYLVSAWLSNYHRFSDKIREIYCLTRSWRATSSSADALASAPQDSR